MKNPPAFSALNEVGLEKAYGMTLRDYFAAHAMQGICASGPSLEWSSDRLAAEAYDFADAMLKARES